jgi:NAD(P)-dependent dehydrogenase (short-subunit alcohol dehydrogenase family)
MSVNSPLCAITGPTSGIGEATALELARRGCGLLLLCRDPGKGELLAQRCRDLGARCAEVCECDLASLDSVRRCAAEIRQQVKCIDVLINNAGVICNRRQLSVDGYELMFAVNHLGHFLLTNQLLPLLRAAPQGRIINVASLAHAFVRGINFDDLNYERGFATFKVYGHSKLCNMLYTLALQDKLQDTAVTVNALHPGAVSTNLGTQNGWYVRPLYALLRLFFRSPEKGARSSVFLACEPQGGTSRGKYFYDCKAIAPKPWALDKKAAAQLWQVSAELVGIED